METLQRTANRGSVSTGYDIDNSCKFEADNSEYLSRTPSSAGNRRTWTFSGWVKRTEIGSGGNTILSAGDTYIQFDGNALQINFRAASENFFIITNRLFRDTSAWYHIVVQCDTTQGTASNRAKVWVNGVQETSFSTSTYDNMSQNYDTLMNSTNEHEVGKYSNEETTYANFFSGYMAETHYVNGTALDQDSFGEFDEDSGIWKPKEYTGSHGSKGFYLKFDDSSNLGKDSATSGIGDFTVSNITAVDQATDTPTNNFCTWNPQWEYLYQPLFSNGATVAGYHDSTDENAKSTIGLTNGKWYWEAQPSGTIGSQFIGIATANTAYTIGGEGLTQNYNMTIEPQGRYYSYSGSLSESSAGQFTALSTSDVLGIALDMDSSTQTIKYYANGSLILTRDLISNMQGKTVFPFLQNYESRTFNINFGGFTVNTISSAASDANGYGTFEHAPPSGYYAICTKNLAQYG
jgi:hypothetical protein